MIEVEVTNHQSTMPLECERLEAAVRAVFDEAAAAAVSVAVVDDATIGRLNARYLDHEGPTDVLSFVLDQSDDHLEGEVVVSAERALAVAPQFGWSPEDELLLYVVHGALHLLGYDDGTRPQRAAMRRRERACLAQLGVEARFRRQSSRRPEKGDKSCLPGHRPQVGRGPEDASHKLDLSPFSAVDASTDLPCDDEEVP